MATLPEQKSVFRSIIPASAVKYKKNPENKSRASRRPARLLAAFVLFPALRLVIRSKVPAGLQRKILKKAQKQVSSTTFFGSFRETPEKRLTRLVLRVKISTMRQTAGYKFIVYPKINVRERRKHMYKIVRKEALRPTVTLYEIDAPLIAKKAQPGQFIILRVDEKGERIPITINAYDPEKGTVTIIVQTVGATTEKLTHLNEGDCLQDFVGPLGKATETEGKKKVCVVGGGVGCAIAYPVLKKFHDDGAEVHAVVGFKNKDLVILEEDFKKSSDQLIVCTDDGSYGQKGLVTDALKQLIDAGNQYDEVFAIGPMIMMKFVSKTTEPYGIPTTVSMSPIMIDGTGMCGGCRLSVGGEMKFACVDGPDFDGHKVDWDLAVKRNQMYMEFEKHKHEETCNLFKKEAE
jgi:ferredoxin--NADP+ reductase